MLDDGPTAPAAAAGSHHRGSSSSCTSRSRQVHACSRLSDTRSSSSDARYAGLGPGRLRPGDWRELTRDEVRALPTARRPLSCPAAWCPTTRSAGRSSPRAAGRRSGSGRRPCPPARSTEPRRRSPRAAPTELGLGLAARQAHDVRHVDQPLPFDTAIVTVEPGSASAPAFGSCATTVPSSRKDLARRDLEAGVDESIALRSRSGRPRSGRPPCPGRRRPAGSRSSPPRPRRLLRDPGRRRSLGRIARRGRDVRQEAVVLQPRDGLIERQPSTPGTARVLLGEVPRCRDAAEDEEQEQQEPRRESKRERRRASCRTASRSSDPSARWRIVSFSWTTASSRSCRPAREVRPVVGRARRARPPSRRRHAARSCRRCRGCDSSMRAVAYPAAGPAKPRGAGGTGACQRSASRTKPIRSYIAARVGAAATLASRRRRPAGAGARARPPAARGTARARA